MDSASECAPPTARTSLSDDASRAESASPLKPKAFRLKGPSKDRFEQIFKHGIAYRSPLARLLCLNGTGLVGIAVAKKLGSHPIRNRLKRQCREVIRASAGSILPERDYILIVGEPAAKANFQELTDQLRNALDTINRRVIPEKQAEAG